jgi:hypothetical protein
MEPLVIPEPVSWLPATPGWWILACWLAGMFLVVAWRAMNRWRNNRYRREALAVLDAGSGAPAAVDIARVLKRAALAAYPRERVASLSGNAWAAFLKETSGDDPVVAEAAERLARAAYQQDVDPAALVEPARRWIRGHRA